MGRGPTKPRKLSEFTADNPPTKNLFPENWEQGKPSYRDCQRVLAVVVLHGGQIANKFLKRKPNVGNVSGYIGRQTSFPMKKSQVASCLSDLQKKGLIYTVTNKVGYHSVYLVDGDTKADEWAMEELRRVIIERRKKSQSKPKEMPKDYKAVPEWQREEEAAKKIVVVNPQPSASNVAAEVDYGKLADQLLVTVMEKVADTGKASKGQVAAIEKELHDAKQYAFELENQLKAVKAQREQMEINLTAAVEAAKELHDRLDKYETRSNSQKDRNHKLTELIDEKSRLALEQIKKSL